jgi:hypothetical protein
MTVTTDYDPEAAAAAGARMLDERLPGWRDHVDPARLDQADPTYFPDLSDCTGCVMAQLDAWQTPDPTRVAGRFADGLDRLLGEAMPYPERVAFAVEFGFRIPDDRHFGVGEVPQAEALYVRLTEAWRRQLQERPA